ncbi:MAG: hypothetical protein FWD81_03845 [Methanomassiliicoccaceae archaeon]|nr:hypothetical protein [Methanomassiliicoccaceae archaeon]
MRLSTGKEIEIVRGKTLKLKNVLSKEINSQDVSEMQKAMHMFQSYTKSKSLTTYGPLIIRSNIAFENGTLIQRSRMMIQVRETPDKVDSPYYFDELVRVENCVMARYRGDPNSVQMARGKISVYAFENDIQLKGDMYTVFVEQNENGIMADVFAETEQ